VTFKITASGSGLTQTDVYHFDHERMSAEDKVLFNKIVSEQTLAGRLAAIECDSIATLSVAGLPTGPAAYECGFANDPWAIVKHRGFAPDSKEGFAARMLGHIIFVRENLEDGDHERAAMLMFFLGVIWSASSIKERHGSNSRPKEPARKKDRDVEMAREFQRRRDIGTQQSASALKADIGAKQTRPLRRSSAIAAINRGLKILSS